MKKAIESRLGIDLGGRIKVMREDRGMTQRTLAAKLGKAIESISNLERGKIIISLSTLQRVSEIFDVPLKEFFDDVVPSDELSQRSKFAATIVNSVRTLSEQDQELVAGLIQLLEDRAGRVVLEPEPGPAPLPKQDANPEPEPEPDPESEIASQATPSKNKWSKLRRQKKARSKIR